MGRIGVIKMKQMLKINGGGLLFTNIKRLKSNLSNDWREYYLVPTPIGASYGL